jgi:NAD(P)-dependent dehydrogenase (short-subunit alcohol dehydrogenase family)
MRLEGKVAIVTGAGSGIGRASAILFAQEGARVVVGDISEEMGQATVDMVRMAGGEALFVQADVSKSSEVQALMRSCVEQYNTLDVLFNCAAVSFIREDCPVADLSEELWNTTIAVNLTGTFLCCKYAIPIMVKNKTGSIINIISRACLVASWGHAYSASKAGVLSLTRNIAISYAGDNIRANSISPGGIETPMNLQLRDTPERAEAYLKGLPLYRLAQPVEVARLALYLASDESPHVTATMIPIDAGASAV